MGNFGVVLTVLGIIVFFAGAMTPGFIIFIIGLALIWLESLAEKENRHTDQYGKIARCPKCGSLNVYQMNFDDKRQSIAFWGVASSKIGKIYHCDNCGNEW